MTHSEYTMNMREFADNFGLDYQEVVAKIGYERRKNGNEYGTTINRKRYFTQGEVEELKLLFGINVKRRDSRKNIREHTPHLHEIIAAQKETMESQKMQIVELNERLKEQNKLMANQQTLLLNEQEKSRRLQIAYDEERTLSTWERFWKKRKEKNVNPTVNDA
jgi:uncharacterized FAD-dependent dehydrogenase